MVQDDKIYVDATQPATLRYPGGSVDCPTLISWHELPAKDREKATIKVNVADGPLYAAQDIDRLHYGHCL